MDKLTSILVVINPADESRHVLAKAIVLARHFGARLELFLCDSEYAYTLSHAYDPAGVQAARERCLCTWQRYLDSLRLSIAEDVRVTTHVACESPLYEAIVHRVLESRPDLVIKCAAGRPVLNRPTLDANDWQLARTCPAPLMLTRGRPWNARPHFAAALDVTDNGADKLARAILETAVFLKQGCRGDLDVVFSEAALDDAEGAASRRKCLARLGEELHIDVGHVAVLEGAPEDTLPAWAAQQDVDVIVMGALTRRRGFSSLVGSLTSKLVDAVPSDFVLIKPDAYSCPVAAPSCAVNA